MVDCVYIGNRGVQRGTVAQVPFGNFDTLRHGPVPLRIIRHYQRAHRVPMFEQSIYQMMTDASRCPCNQNPHCTLPSIGCGWLRLFLQICLSPARIAD
jgi:hypothetical protein